MDGLRTRVQLPAPPPKLTCTIPAPYMGAGIVQPSTRRGSHLVRASGPLFQDNFSYNYGPSQRETITDVWKWFQAPGAMGERWAQLRQVPGRVCMTQLSDGVLVKPVGMHERPLCHSNGLLAGGESSRGIRAPLATVFSFLFPACWSRSQPR